jgi:hypothetical protein
LLAPEVVCAKFLIDTTGSYFMLSNSAPETRSGFRIYLMVSAVAFIFVGLYVGWIFYSRWEANQALVEHAAEKQRSKDEQAFEAMGGNRFDILSYAANPSTIHAGEKSLLCYSVSNAKAVNIEPQSEEPVWPAYSRCVHVSPRKTTTYSLTIGDGAGHTKTGAVEVTVQ